MGIGGKGDKIGVCSLTNRNIPVHELLLVHPPGVKKGFIKGEAFQLVRTNSSKITFERNIRNFKNRLLERSYPAAILRNLPTGKQPFNRETNPHVKKTSTFCDTIPPGFT